MARAGAMKLYGYPPTRAARVETVKLLEGLPNLTAYLERMYARPKAPPRIAEAFARAKR